MQLPIVKSLCGANQVEAASLLKELVRNLEEIQHLAHQELMHHPDLTHLQEIKALARDSIEHAKSK